jgi:hypothetical protein
MHGNRNGDHTCGISETMARVLSFATRSLKSAHNDFTRWTQVIDCHCWGDAKVFTANKLSCMNENSS